MKKARPRVAFVGDLLPVDIKEHTGFEHTRWRGVVECLRTGFYFVTDQQVGGAAPKDFIRVYERAEHIRKNDPRTWPAFIAKVGHKRYPSESITEQLLTRIGQVMGFTVADSQLMHARDQIRFLSRYFLVEKESLVHGAQIAASYLEDPKFVDYVRDERLEREIFTFQALYMAIMKRLPDEAEHILRGFALMIAFDALVGNQDRHLYNWGVIVHAEARRPPRFSPIYDTARALFWNAPESSLSKFETDDDLSRYIEGAHPLIGWDNYDGAKWTHFDLVTRVAHFDHDMRATMRSVELSRLGRVEQMIDGEFGRLLSFPRRELIKRCLRARFARYALAVA